MNILTYILSNTIIAFIILISIVIFVHELGHFIAGKIFKIQVEEFSIGFGPAAYSFKKGSTSYRINWLPLGGYVRFYGADLEENIPLQNQEKSLLHAKVYKRALVSFAGPFANFVLSFFIMTAIVWHGIPAQPTIISVLPNSVAENSGLQTGDKIVSINNQKMENWNDLVKKISLSPNEKLTLTIERKNKIVSLPITPKAQASETVYGTEEQSGKIGITPFFSIAGIIPNKNDFFSTIGLKPGDKITAINNKKINYFHEFFTTISTITESNSDIDIAQKILRGELNDIHLNISLIRKKTSKNTDKNYSLPIHISVDFTSNTLKIWAKNIANNIPPYKSNSLPQFKNNIWNKITASTDLTISSFTKETINQKSLKAWTECGLNSGMTIQSLESRNELFQSNEINLINIMQVYSFFENLEKALSKSNNAKMSLIPIKIKVTDLNGSEKNFSCSIPLSQKINSLNKEKKFIEFPFVFESTPTSLPSIYIEAHSLTDVFSKSFEYLLNQISMIYKGLKMLISGSIPLSNLGGPIAIASIAGDAAKAGIMTFLLTMSLISVNIGMVNLLPLPALDGGALLLYLVEAFYGKPLPTQVQFVVQRIGIFIILFLFVLVFYNDILRLVRP